MGEEEEADGGEEEPKEEERLGRNDDNKDRDGAGRNKEVPSTFCCWAPTSSGASWAASRARREDGCWTTTTPRRVVLDGNERGRRGMILA